MDYLKEILQFFFAVAVAGGLMYVWFNHLSPWGDPNKKLKENADRWSGRASRDEIMKELDNE